MKEQILTKKTERKEGQAEYEELYKRMEARDDTALIFLKGGEHGGLEPKLKDEVITKLEQWFEVALGEEKELDFNEVVERWGKGYLKYPTLGVMKENPEIAVDFLQKGEELLHKKDEQGFNEWLAEAREKA